MDDDDKRGIVEDIPPKFWGTVTPEEFESVYKTNGLGPELCKRLWAMEGRTGAAPEFIKVYLSADDIDEIRKQ